MTDFIDRTEEQIKQDIEKNYDVIDGSLGNGRRDDRDALEAAKVVLQKYIAEDLLGYEGNLVLGTKNNAWGSGEILDNIPDEVKKSQGWVIHEYEVLINELNQNIRDLEGTNHYLWTSVAPHIQRLAGRINSAESKVLINRRLYQAKRDIYDTFGLNVTYKEPNYFGSQEVNGIPMDEILKNSIVQGAKGDIFFLDYSACIDDAGDPQIKKDILEKTGNYLISLRFDEATNKFEYYDMNGNALDIHPIAWKGIVLGKKGVIDSTHYIHESPIFSWVVNGKMLDDIIGNKVDKLGNFSFTLDYSDCSNAEIKSQVVALMGDPVVDLNYDKDGLGFYFVNKSGERVHWDIKMWEGVRVASHEYNNYLQLQRENEQLSSAREQFDTESHSRYFALRSEIMGSDGMLSLDKLKGIEKYKNILDQLDNLAPKWSKGLEDSEAVDLIISIESRLDEVVYKNKRYGFDLDVGEAVSRDGSGYYQANFVGGSDIIREVLFKVDGMTNQGQTMLLPRKEFSKLYELKDFMSARLRDKRNSGAFDQYELAESFIVQGKRIDTNDENEINKLELRNYGLSQLLKGCDDFKKEYEEGGDSQPPELQALMREIRKYYRTLNNDFGNKKSWTDSEWMSVKDNLFSLFLKFKNNDGNYASMTDTTAKEYFDAIFSGSDKADIDLAVKSLCNGLTFLDNTTAQIDPDSYKEDLRIKDTNYEYYWKNITKKLSIDINSNDSDEGDEFVFDPEENKVIIDNLLGEIRGLSSVNHEEKLVKFIKYLQSPLEFLPKNVNFEDNEEVKKSAESILSALENKISFLDSKKRELSPKQYRESLKNREKELQGKELNDEELVELNGINAMLELSDKELKEYYLDDINKSAEISLKYGAMSTIFDGQLTQYLVKKGGGVYGTSEKSQAVASQINDSFGLRGWWDWSDETCKAAAPFLQDLLIEVAITATAIALGAVTAGAGTAAIATLRATAFAAKAAKVASLASKVSKFGKVERIARVIGSGSRKIIRISNRIKDTKYVKTTLGLAQRAKTTVAGTVERTASTRVGRMLYRNTEWIRQTSFWSKGESIGKMIARGNALRQTTTGYKFAGFLIEGTGFHVSSTALHNAINGQNIMDGLNPFGTTEVVDPETGEKIVVSNARGYAESIAFLGVLKAVGAPIQNLTQNTLGDLLKTQLTEGIFKNAITNCVSVGGEVASLGITEQVLNQVFEGEWKKMTMEDFIRSLGMVLGLRCTGMLGKGVDFVIKDFDIASSEMDIRVKGTDISVRINKEGVVIESSDPRIKVGESVFGYKELRSGEISTIEREQLAGKTGREREVTRTVEASEFVEIDEVQKRELQEKLTGIISTTNYDSIDLYLKWVREVQSGKTPEEAFSNIYLGAVSKERGTICTGMARLLQQQLEASGIYSYMIRFRAGGTRNDEYLGDGHTALIIPSKVRKLSGDVESFTLLDPGLMIPEPITFSTENTIDKPFSGVLRSGDRYEVYYEPSDPVYPFRMNRYKVDEDGIISNKATPFYLNPREEWVNPETTLNKEILRVFSDLKIANSDENGVNKSYLRILLPEQNGGKPKFEIKNDKMGEVVTEEEFLKIKDLLSIIDANQNLCGKLDNLKMTWYNDVPTKKDIKKGITPEMKKKTNEETFDALISNLEEYNYFKSLLQLFGKDISTMDNRTMRTEIGKIVIAYNFKKVCIGLGRDVQETYDNFLLGARYSNLYADEVQNPKPKPDSESKPKDKKE